jgi:iron complex outermembrane receptor protein
MRFVLIPLLFVLSSVKTLSAQTAQTGSISGRVFFSERDIISSSIGIPTLGIGTTSDPDGAFELRNVPAGEHVLVVSALGYKNIERKITIVPGETLKLVFRPQEDTYFLSEVVVVDEQSGLARNTPYNITSISIKEISLKSNPSGLMGFLREEPGIYGAEMGHGIVKPFIRGLGFSRVVTIFQNNKLENHPWGADHGLGINDLGVRKVDVIKGPASILYGSGAIGGVILVKDDESYLSLRRWTGNVGTTFNSVSGGIRTFGSAGRTFDSGFFLAADAAYENHADYLDGNGRIIGNSRFNIENYRFHTGLHRDKFSNKLSYTYLRQNLGIIEEDEMDDDKSLATTRYDRRMQLPLQDVKDHIITYKQNTEHERWSTFFTVSHHINDRKEIEEAFDEVDLGLIQSHTFYNTRATHKTSEVFEQSLGLQGSFINLTNMEEAEEILIPDATSFENGIYYFANLSLGQYFLQGGLRYDFRRVNADASAPHLIDYGFELPGNPPSRKLSRNFSGFTGSLGISRKIKEVNTFKMNFSTGYRAPDLAELFSNGPHPGTNRFEVGDADFRREQSYQADLSWVYNVQKWTSSISFFGNLVDNYTFFAGTGEILPNDLEIWRFQQADALLYGAEFFLAYRPMSDERLELSLQGSLVRGERRDIEQPLTFIPADNYAMRVKFHPFQNGNTFIFSSLRYVDRQNRPGLNEERTPMYLLFNAGVSHRFRLGERSLSAGLSAFNLFNRVFVDHMSILRAFNVTSPGRNLMASVIYNF